MKRLTIVLLIFLVMPLGWTSFVYFAPKKAVALESALLGFYGTLRTETSPFERNEVSWEEELKSDLLAAYPISRQGMGLLERTKVVGIPPNHFAGGYALLWNAIEFRALYSRPQLSLHEFSHVAFYQMVVGGQEKNYKPVSSKLEQALFESFYGANQNVFTACFSLNYDPGWFKHDTEHAFIAVIEWSGGNLALIPEPLREFAPWLEYRDGITWEQITDFYMGGDVQTKGMLKLRYGEDNPLWRCSEFSMIGSRRSHELKNTTFRIEPSAIDKVFLDAEEREIRTFLAGLGEGRFSLWQKYFTERFEWYQKDLLRRAILRHPHLVIKLINISEILDGIEAKELPAEDLFVSKVFRRINIDEEEKPSDLLKFYLGSVLKDREKLKRGITGATARGELAHAYFADISVRNGRHSDTLPKYVELMIKSLCFEWKKENGLPQSITAVYYKTLRGRSFATDLVSVNIEDSASPLCELAKGKEAEG